MANSNSFDVIIIGGSYAGLSAAMALGRSLRQVLIVDSGDPCNKQTPYSHNFLTCDGQTPGEIAHKAMGQVLQYDTVKMYRGTALEGLKRDDGFAVTTVSDEIFIAKKLLFATGVTDLFPSIRGFAECWGISVLHCPYCHGYEVRQQEVAVLGNGNMGFELSRLISNWTTSLSLLTHGAATLAEEQREKLGQHNIEIVEKEIDGFEHAEGQLKNIVFADGSKKGVTALFAKPGFQQKCAIPVDLGCLLTEQGYLQIDDFHRTNIPGVYAAGDNTTPFRAVSVATAAGTKAGAVINKDLIDATF